VGFDVIEGLIIIFDFLYKSTTFLFSLSSRNNNFLPEIQPHATQPQRIWLEIK